MGSLYGRLRGENQQVNLDPASSVIDQIMKLGEQQNPITLTAQIIRDRANNKASIIKSLNEAGKEDENDESNNGSEGDNKSTQDEGGGDGDAQTPPAEGDGSGDGAGGKVEGDTPAPKEGEQAEAEPAEAPAEPATKSKDDGEESSSDYQHVTSAKDVDALIGSGLGETSSAPPAKAPEKVPPKEATPAKENFQLTDDFFQRFKFAHEQYVGEVKEMNPNAVPNTPEERPVVYVAKDIVDALTRMIGVSAQYIDYTGKLSEKVANIAKEVNDVVGTYKTYLGESRVKYSYKLLEDTDLLGKVGIEGNTDLRVSAKALHAFNEESAKLILHILNNDFTAIASAIASSGFVKTEKNINIEKVHEYQFRGKIPGFYRINATLQDYTDYLTVNTKTYGFFKTNGAPQNVLLDLPAISITKDKDLTATLQSLDTILVETVALCDNLSTIRESVNRFIGTVKEKIFDINQANVKQLSALKIDETIKQFIQLKLAIELMAVTSEVNLSFLSASISVIPQVATCSDTDENLKK